MRPETRRDRIVEIVRERARVSVDALAEELDTSRETIRRDLTDLAGRGYIRKFHGGAALPDLQGEGPFQARMADNPTSKRQIAKQAASLFRPGDTLFIDTGTTTVAFAEELVKTPGLTVITNSASIAQIMSRNDNGSRVFLLGGEYRADANEALGPLTVEQIGRFRAHDVVLTAGAVDAAAGVMDFSVEETEVARAMIAQAQTVTVLADSSKHGQVALFQVCSLDRVDRLVVDRLADKALAEALRAAGVEIRLAEQQSA